MITIDINDLMKAKALIDLTNSVPLDEVNWTQDDQSIAIPEYVVDEWKFVGLSNHYFAYMNLVPNVKLRGAALLRRPARTTGQAVNYEAIPDPTLCLFETINYNSTKANDQCTENNLGCYGLRHAMYF